MEMNLDLRDTDNVILSFDLARHKADRQISCEYGYIIYGNVILSFNFTKYKVERQINNN